MNDLFTSVGGILAILFVLLITREIWTWFLKQNKIVEQNREIIRLLSKLANEPEPPSDAEKLGKKIGGIFGK